MDDWKRIAICDVCGARGRIQITALLDGLASIKRCLDCATAGAVPMQLAIEQAAVEGGVDQLDEQWRQMVDNTWLHLGLTEEEFTKKVDEEIAAMEM